ncbi:MAG: glycosyltransferase family 9 protein [Candidatus Omnitrophica bacterium]|nr:glycosyltransferase family 9 protein [Candidatus Omnitrophota bacterium]
MMCARLSKKSFIKRILVISMTNIGDVVLSCPVIDILRRDFPQARIDVVVGKKAVSLFENNPHINIKIFDKQASLKQKYAWFMDLYQARYDVVVDLRRTLLGWLLRPRFATPVLFSVPLRSLIPMSLRAPKGRSNLLTHKKDIHLNRLRQVYEYPTLSSDLTAIVTTKEDERFFEENIAPALQSKNFIVIACGAADTAKRWGPHGFAVVAQYLSGHYKIIFVGDDKDALLINDIQGRMKTSVLSLAGKINLRQLACIIKKSSWVLCHDSGVMHLACYFDVPVVALWGPTDLAKYAPWGKKFQIVRRNEQCVRCKDPKATVAHNCMSFIEVDDVLNAVKKIEA